MPPGTRTYTVTVSGIGGCTATASTTVTVNPLPVITGPTSVCTGYMIQLLPSSGGTWISSNNSVATITNAGVVTGVIPGMVTFTFTNTATGCSSTSPGSYRVKPTPVSTITTSPTIYQGSSGNSSFNPMQERANRQRIFISGMITAGGTTTHHFGVSTPPSMMISVTVTAANGCSSSGNVTVTVLVPGPSTMQWVPDNLHHSGMRSSYQLPSGYTLF